MSNDDISHVIVCDRYSLSYHNITNAGIVQLAAALPACSSLKSLNLIGCEGADATGYRAVIDVLDSGACPTLRVCSLVFVDTTRFAGRMNDKTLLWKKAIKEELEGVMRKRQAANPQLKQQQKRGMEEEEQDEMEEDEEENDDGMAMDN